VNPKQTGANLEQTRNRKEIIMTTAETNPNPNDPNDPTDSLPWQDGNPKLLGGPDGDVIFAHVFETDQRSEAYDFAEAIKGQVYTWITSGYWNQLSIGFANANRFLFVVLPPSSILREPDGSWPEFFPLADDECDPDEGDECDDDTDETEQ
jgi:hypothetical protein